MFFTKLSTFSGISKDAHDIDHVMEETWIVALRSQLHYQAVYRLHQHQHVIDPRQW